VPSAAGADPPGAVAVAARPFLRDEAAVASASAAAMFLLLPLALGKPASRLSTRFSSDFVRLCSAATHPIAPSAMTTAMTVVPIQIELFREVPLDINQVSLPRKWLRPSYRRPFEINRAPSLARGRGHFNSPDSANHWHDRRKNLTLLHTCDHNPRSNGRRG
jgi:hypothetical protein